MQYWVFNGEANHYWPIGKGFVLYVDGKVAYGNTYGGKTYENSTQDGIIQAGQSVAFPFWIISTPAV